MEDETFLPTLWLHGSLNEDNVQPTTKCRYCTRNLCPPSFQDNPLACAMMQAMMTPMSGSEDHPGLTVWWIFCIADSSPCELHCYKNQSVCKDIQTSGTRPSSCLPLSRDLPRYQRVALEHLNSLIHAALPTVVPCSDPTEVSECLLGSLQDPNGQERNAH